MDDSFQLFKCGCFLLKLFRLTKVAQSIIFYLAYPFTGNAVTTANRFKGLTFGVLTKTITGSENITSALWQYQKTHSSVVPISHRPNIMSSLGLDRHYTIGKEIKQVGSKSFRAHR